MNSEVVTNSGTGTNSGVMMSAAHDDPAAAIPPWGSSTAVSSSTARLLWYRFRITLHRRWAAT